jgi:hypothetical protein
MSDYYNQLLPEERLLLTLCRLQFTEEQKKEIGELMKQVTDWDKFVTLSNEHGIIALSWYNITETGNKDFIPPIFLEKMNSGYLKSLTRNTCIFELLNEVLGLASKKNIKVVLLKGLVLEKSVYGDKGLRQMNDLDILVRQEDAMNLRKILIKNGFEPFPMVSPLHQMMASYLNHLPAMYKNGLSVEIHYKLFNENDNLLTSEFFDKSVPSGLSSYIAFIPQPQLHFLYLVKHLAEHEAGGDSQLRLYTDMAVMLDLFMDKILNPELFKFSGIVNINDSLNSKLAILKVFPGMELPDLPGFVQDKDTGEIVIERFIHFLRHPQNKGLEESPIGYFKQLKNTSGIFNKFLFILGHLFPSFTYMKYRYMKKTKVGTIRYYPVRWAQMVRLILNRKV